MKLITWIQKNRKKTVLIVGSVALLALLIAILVICLPKTDKKNSGSTKKTTEDSKTETPKTPAPLDTSNATLLESDSTAKPILDESAQNPVIYESDPEPEKKLKEQQASFVKYMNEKEYEKAKEVLDNYFYNSAYATAAVNGGNTYDNYVYYYETQKMYAESAVYQLDFIEKEMGLDNVISTNIRWIRLQETLKHVSLQDERLEKIQASVNRWTEITSLMQSKQYDSAIEKLRTDISNGLQCAYAYYYLAQAYNATEQYYKEYQTYQVILLRFREKTLNTLESSFSAVFTDHIEGLYNQYKVNEEQRAEIEENTTLNTLP